MNYRRYNRSYTYILPMLGNSYMQFTKNDPDNPSESILIDTYLRSEYAPKYKEHLFLRYKVIPRYGPIYKWLESHSYYEDSYDYDDEIVYCFKIPYSKLTDYIHFINSSYSKMSEIYKRHILKFHGLRVTNNVAKVLYKDESLYLEMEEQLGNTHIPRTQEIGEKIELKNETHKKKSKLTLIKYKPIWE